VLFHNFFIGARSELSCCGDLQRYHKELKTAAGHVAVGFWTDLWHKNVWTPLCESRATTKAPTRSKSDSTAGKSIETFAMCRVKGPGKGKHPARTDS
jgi:hypothetical protein